jgi:hypothetical protein
LRFRVQGSGFLVPVLRFVESLYQVAALYTSLGTSVLKNVMDSKNKRLGAITPSLTQNPEPRTWNPEPR